MYKDFQNVIIKLERIKASKNEKVVRTARERK